MKQPVAVAVPLRLCYTERMGGGSSVESWHRFLRCWAEAFAREHEKQSGAGPAACVELPIVEIVGTFRQTGHIPEGLAYCSEPGFE